MLLDQVFHHPSDKALGGGEEERKEKKTIVWNMCYIWSYDYKLMVLPGWKWFM